MNNKMIWASLMSGGLMATALGFGALDSGYPGSSAVLPAIAVLLLLTGGLASCLSGLIGMTGLMAWIPGLEHPEPSSASSPPAENRNI
ncbi:hypothetical protein [Janthinobacterium agaricidamnosum]|uniref:Transmembrane protein n=1 Tax=Janthinobacterium agaricidamnosum NBRC 102515 = DSM 9628 TaxID=1349767 RepID=W0V9T9_9BURK|nr:hypothetical protein [Janthinobacterium agaricidamnosum]CDG84370.1 hypothetical protein GJA_3755 [Janthinobacterium agaricidamnosum NBRC 102515 = DSM 9628]